MINSRKIEDLHPLVAEMAKKFVEECKKVNIDIIITSTYRDIESQNDIYAQGRTKPGIIVTKAKGGNSMHNYKVAFDIVPKEDGKANYNSKNWDKIGKIGMSVGLFWGKNFVGFCDTPHFQYTGKANNGTALNHFKNGGILEQLV